MKASLNYVSGWTRGTASVMGTATSLSAASLIDHISGVENRLSVQPSCSSLHPCPHRDTAGKLEGNCRVTRRPLVVKKKIEGGKSSPQEQGGDLPDSSV